MDRGINIGKGRVTVVFPVATMLDEEIMFNADEPKVIKTSIRHNLKYIAWTKMWRHAGHKLEHLKGKFVGSETTVTGEDVMVTFFHEFPAVPEDIPHERPV